MTKRTRRNHSPGFKANVAMGAIRGDKTLAELAQHCDVPPNQIQDWKQRLLSQAKRWFEHGSAHAGTEGEEKVQSLHAKLGALTMARDVLSKARWRPMSARRALLQAGDRLPVTRQCRRRGLSRSTASSRPLAVPAAELSRMRAIDESQLTYPCYGRRRVRDELAHRGHGVTHRNRSQRLMRQRGPAALSPKRRPSAPGIGHQRYPYRLRGLTINRPNQVWAADSCYLPRARGCMELVAIMDWHTRKGLAFRRSNTRDTDFCLAALKDARARCGRPERCNTDQAAQFTSATFTGVRKAHAITIRMDGKGRWVDHVCVARRWRTVKYQDIYLKAYATPRDRRRGLADYFRCYHTRRRQAALDRRTPDAAYFGELGMPKAA